MKEAIKRIEWVDALKGVAIIWLMIYHFYIVEWLRSPVFIFFFLSGLFYSSDSSFATFLKKKARVLLIPFLFFFVLGLIVSYFGTVAIGKKFVFPHVWQLLTLIPVEAEVHNPLGVGAIWFLVSLFEIYVFYYLIRLLSTNKIFILIFTGLLWLFASFILEKFAMGSLVYMICSLSFLPFFVVAHLFREHVLNKQNPLWVIGVAIVVYLFTLIPISESIIKPTFLRGLDVMGGGIILRIKDLIGSSALIIILIEIAKRVGEKIKNHCRYVNRFLVYEGGNSLIILGVHFLLQPILFHAIKLLFGDMINAVLLYFLLFVLELIFCNICICLFSRYIPFFVNKKYK